MADTATQPAGSDSQRGDRRDHHDRDSRSGHGRGHNDRWTRGRGGRGRGNGRGGRGAREGFRGRGGNNDHGRSTRSTDEPSSDPEEIRAQVEFYFSNSNLSKDKFLFEKTGGPENKPVDIETIASFSLMRRYRPFEAVVNALKESDSLEVNDKNQVFRKEPLKTLSDDFDENRRLLAEQALPKTLYVKGFRHDSDIKKVQQKIQNFFKPYGIAEVRLRRLGDDVKTFKGSVFVEFMEVSDAEKFLAQTHKFDGRDLEVLTKQAYIKREVDKIMAEVDTEGVKDEAVVAAARKVLENEYMDPQAPPQSTGKKTEESSNVPADVASKAKAKHVEKQNKAFEARKAQRNGESRPKRARDEDKDDGEPEAKRARDDEVAAPVEELKKEEAAPETANGETAAEQAEEPAKDEKPAPEVANGETAAEPAQAEAQDEKPASETVNGEATT